MPDQGTPPEGGKPKRTNQNPQADRPHATLTHIDRSPVNLTDEIRYETDGAIATVTIDRPRSATPSTRA